MTDTPWTPGPWHVYGGDPPGWIGVKGASFKIRAPIYATDLTRDDAVQRAADANLIAAAPDMAEALVSARETILHLVNAFSSEAEGSNADWVADIDAALAKAQGQL